MNSQDRQVEQLRLFAEEPRRPTPLEEWRWRIEDELAVDLDALLVTTS